MALPPNGGPQRHRAFGILRVSAEAIDTLRTTVRPDDARDLYLTAHAIAIQLYAASGAGPDGRGAAHDGFADEAFGILEAIAEFKEPSIVHRMVETLGHLAPAAPSRAFHIVERAISAGDAYTYDRMAADVTVGLIARYLAEFRDVLAADAGLLFAVTNVLGSFARVGWPAAVSLTVRLSDVFR